MSGEEPTTGGTYTLVIELPSATTIDVGALGERRFQAGWYAYTGSALGPGGFARVQRHADVAAGRRDTRHWHVDHLLGAGSSEIDTVTRSPGVAAECVVADRLQDAATESVADFGVSDCDCPTHLVHDPRRDRLLGAVGAAHGSAREQASRAASD